MDQNEDRIVYQLSIADLQTVADDILERELTEKEIERIEDKLGDFIGWYDAIQNTIETLKIK